MSETIWTTMPSPVGELLLTGDGHTLHALRLANADAPGVVVTGASSRVDCVGSCRYSTTSTPEKAFCWLVTQTNAGHQRSPVITLICGHLSFSRRLMLSRSSRA